MKAAHAITKPLALGLALLGLALPCAQAQSINQALNRPASATGNYTGNGYSIASGNDGNLGTIWNGGSHDASWTVDMESLMLIDSVVVNSMDGPGYHIAFQLTSSTNGSDWTPIGGLTVGSGPAWSSAFNTSGAAMRYITFTTIGQGGSDWASLAELQAFGVAAGTSQVPVPATLGLIALGFAGLALARRRVFNPDTQA